MLSKTKETQKKRRRGRRGGREYRLEEGGTAEPELVEWLSELWERLEEEAISVQRLPAPPPAVVAADGSLGRFLKIRWAEEIEAAVRKRRFL